tara:strand:+ start:80 stop:1285 length:1206 start_codon:yes stop_codon:yes gene_type:complete
MSHTPWHGDGGTYKGKHSEYKGYGDKQPSPTVAAHNKKQKEKELKDWGDNKSVDSVTINNPNINKKEGFINQKSDNVINDNSQKTLQTGTLSNLPIAVSTPEVAAKNKKKWGLNNYATDNLNGGKIDTSPGVVDEISDLHDAAKEMAVLLGLNPHNKRDLQKALNFLSGDEWGSQASLRTTANNDAINTLKNSLGKDEDGNQKKWKTWGTGLRGDSRWKGVGPLDKDKYSGALSAMAANVQAGTPAFDYHRALVNSHKPLKSDAGLLETIFTAFMPGSQMLKNSGLANWLNEHNDVGKIGVDENGIFDFEYNGQKVNVNEGSAFTDMDWKNFVLSDGDNEVGGNYETYSYDNTGVVDDTDEEETEEGIEEEYNENDEMVAWYDFTLFEKMFSLNKTKGVKV